MRVRPACCLAMLCVSAVLLRADAASGRDTIRLSTDPAAQAGIDPSKGPVATSGNGRYIAFTTSGSLLPFDQNGVDDIYVKDVLTDSLDIVSAPSFQAAGTNDMSFYPSMSLDGRYVAFASTATNFDPLVTVPVGIPQVYVRDRLTTRTTLVSRTSTGGGANAPSDQPSISGSGNAIAFASMATNLAGNTEVGNPFVDVFVSVNGASIVKASVGGLPSGNSYDPSLSQNGCRVAFTSGASLSATDTNGVADVYVRDRCASTTRRISLVDGGLQAGDESGEPSIDAAGEVVAFTSFAALGAALDLNGVGDIYAASLVTDELFLISHADATASAGNDASSGPAIAGDASVVAFTSFASDLVPGDTNGVADVFLGSLGSSIGTISFRPPSIGGVLSRGSLPEPSSAADDGPMQRLSVRGSDGLEGNEDSGDTVVNFDGSLVGFVSAASNLAEEGKIDADPRTPPLGALGPPSDTNGVPDVFASFDDAYRPEVPWTVTSVLRETGLPTP